MNAVTESLTWDKPVFIALPSLNEGEKAVAAVISADSQRREWIILMPGTFKGSWKESMDWAASIGGELPDRAEGALLYNLMRNEFEKEWYWTREQHAAYSTCAWYQHFEDGGQDFNFKDDEWRARAVRRIVIEYSVI